MKFVYETPPVPARVVFGSGTLSCLAHEIRNIGCSKAFILTTPGRAKYVENIKSALGELVVGLYANAAMHTPVNVTEEALQLIKSLGADCLVAFGGGSAIGLAKAVALRTGLPQVAIPTTYSGSEVTPIVGQTYNGVKTTVKALEVVPRVILYDVALTLTLPLQTSIVSGLNAIAHAVEALYSPDANPISDMLSEKGILSLVRSLPRLRTNPQDKEARNDALFGAWLCGTCPASVRMGLHHKLCHILGGSFNAPHAETHAVILPHVVAYNSSFAVPALSKLTTALEITASNAAQGLYDLGLHLGAPRSLKELGLLEEDLEKVAEHAMKEAPYPNPAPLEKHKIWLLLKDAFDGKRPT